MAFKLTRKNDHTWQGAIGDSVTLDIRSENPAKTVRVTYGGTVDSQPPFDFTIKSGLVSALVVALGVKSGQDVEIVEVDGDETQVLKSFFWSKQNFFDFVTVRGV